METAVGVPQITLHSWQDAGVTDPVWDGESGVSADERPEGWGERDWDRPGQGGGGEDPDEKRLREDRPPHHEERER
jgi:hypothetical protein